MMAETEPWLSRKAWSSPEVYSGAKAGMVIMWVFAVVFTGFGAVIIFAAHDDLSDKLRHGEYLVLLAGLFPLVGLFMLAQAIRATRDWMRYGRTPLHLDPYPGSIGGQMGGYIDLALPYASQNRFEVSLALYRRETRRSGKESRTSESVIWQSRVPVHTEDCVLKGAKRGTRLRLQIDVPEGLSESETPDNDYHLWRLSVKALDKSARFQRQWEIPMFATATRAREQLPAVALAEHESAQLDALQELTAMSQEGDTLWMRFTPANTRKLSIMMTVFGAIFFGIGAGMTQADFGGRWLFVVVFGLVGGLILFSGVYGLGKELRVGISPRRITTRRFWFGLGLGNREYDRALADAIALKASGSMSSGQETIQYYRLRLSMREGRDVPLGFGIDGHGRAELLATELAALTGIPYRGS